MDQDKLKIAIAPNAFISAALQDNTECLSVKSDLDAYRRGTTMSIGVNLKKVGLEEEGVCKENTKVSVS